MSLASCHRGCSAGAIELLSGKRNLPVRNCTADARILYLPERNSMASLMRYLGYLPVRRRYST